MPFHPPAFCPEHGLFEATALIIGSGATTTLIHCVTNCPRCGRGSEIIPGVYDATQKNLNVLVDKSISPEALGALRRIIERLQQGEISVHQARAEAEKISPNVAKLFDIANWSDQARATLYAAIIAAVAVVTAAKIASGPSQTIVIQPIIERIIERKSDLLSSSSLRTKKPSPKPQLKRPHKRRR